MNERSTGAEEIVRWARVTEFPTPVQWGVVENRILSVPAPDGNPAPGPNPVFGIPLYVVGAIMYALPVAGVGILFARVGGSIPDSGGWARAAFAAFLIALVVPVVTWEMWRSSGHRRRPMDLTVTALSGVSSAIAFILLQGGSADLGGQMLVVLTAVAAVVGVGAFVLLLLGSNGWRRYTPRSLRPQSREDRSYNNVRARVLETLVKRGVVDEKSIDIPAMLDMPIGSWGELDDRA